MKLEDFGYNELFEKFRLDNNLDSFEIGRVIAEHKEQNCKFKDCTHTNEMECSVLEAVEKGEIDKASY